MFDLLVACVIFGIGCLIAVERLAPGYKASRNVAGLLCFFLGALHQSKNLGWSAEDLGAYFAVGYTGWMLWRLQLPLPISVILVCSQTFVWVAFAFGAERLWHLPTPLNCALIACWGSFLFWIEWTVLPLWGTAQNFASPQPTNHPFIAFFGAAGGTWSTIFTSALFAEILVSVNSAFNRGRPEALFVAVGCLSVFWIIIALLSTIFLSPMNLSTLRVATFGWAEYGLSALSIIPAEFQDAAKEASEKGAKLLVTPEAAIHVQDRTHFRVALCSLAQHHNLALAVGYFDDKLNENCIDFVSAEGEVVGRYVKTHLIPTMENYMRGKGALALMDVDGVKVGGMICQDDNFPDIARRYGKAGVQLLVVPTNDWKRVKDVHFMNHLWRGLESRFALARAAGEGISALTSADGKIESSSDHFKEGLRLLVADVRVGTGKPTLYARFGDWFPIVCGVASIVGLFLSR